MLRIRLLGGFDLEVGGTARALPPGRPARSVLAWLALHPGTHARSRVAAALWPDVLEESARASLRTALAALRRALGPASGALVATREQVGLGPSPDVWVDVRALRALASAGRLEEALALARGELAPELDDEWIGDLRLQHRDEVVALLARLGERYEGRDESGPAIACARRAVALDPLSEEAQRALIRRLARAGDRAAALAAYRRFAERLRRELGLPPSEETRRLVEWLRAGPGDEAPAAGVEPPFPAVLARQRRRVLVGRGAELARLRRAWEAARSGERRLVLIAGEAGVGKTRLAAELAHSAHATGGAVLYGRAYEDPLTAFQPFVEALRPWLDGPAVRPGELARLLPGRAPGVAAAAPPADPGAARYRLFEAVAGVLADLSRRRPVLLVLEDLHCADTPTALLFGHLARVSEPARVLVVATYREGELGAGHALGRLPAELHRERLGDRLVVRGLGADDVAALIRSRGHGSRVTAAAAAIHAAADGNPFFVEEILRHLEEAGPPGDRDAPDLGRLGVPDGVREVIARRLARLGGEVGEVLVLASVLGREFELRTLEALRADAHPERVVEALERAARADLVREEPGRIGRYGFSHALVREALYAGLGATRRARLHGRVAAVLERLHGDSADALPALAHHLHAAAEPETAARAAWYAARAGALALDQLAYERAAQHFGHALEALAIAPPDDLRRCETLLALGDAHVRAGALGAGRRAFERAARAARVLGREDLFARAALGLGGIDVTVGTPDEAVVALLEEALERLGEGEDELRARLLARLAVELYYGPSPARTERLSAAAVELARRRGDERLLAATLNARHVALWRPELLTDRLEVAGSAIASAERAGDAVALLQARNWRVLDLFELGEIDALGGELAAYEELADAVALPAYRFYGPLWRATLAMLEGRWEEARRFSAAARRIGRGHPNAELFFRIQQEHLQLEAGEPAAVLATLEREIPGSAAPAAHRSGIPLLLAMLGRREEARAELRALAGAVLPADANLMPSLAILADAAAHLGDGAAATILHGRLLPYRPRNIVDGRATYCYGAADLYLGLLAGTVGRWDEALDRLAEAREFHRRVGARPHLCRTLCAAAQAHLGRGAAGDAEAATALAAEALELARALGGGELLGRATSVAERVEVGRPGGR